MNTDAYLAVLAWSFVITNAARLFAYLPTISRLARPGCTADGQSQLTWALWTVSNATFTLQLFEQHQRQVDATVLLCFGNVIMNLIILVMVRRAQCRATREVAHPPSCISTTRRPHDEQRTPTQPGVRSSHVPGLL